MAKPNKSKLRRMVAKAGGKENFSKILPANITKEKAARWFKRMEGK